ncbi:uncharacterized protein LOC127102056 [Lathyrus oleraceus]|uniref:uncharacterized protein LOC127102056 n=1 Tax=Pisum sativum TaxID=3888 RepID=UPI0021CFFDA5|nr:uncharacterized protein LOC127102056 [Pisum sativum]
MTDGILATLDQLYDLLYHCFTFPDYQLAPILEEYSYLLGLPISDQIPFSGFEEISKDKVIYKATHLKMSEIKDHMTTKGGILGLPAKFLMDKTCYFASMKIPTLLADTYHSIYLKNSYSGGMKIMYFTHYDIEWYSYAYDEPKIIDSCGEFPNAPFLGTKRDINYNPILTRRQLGYPMKDKPSNILLEGLFFKEAKDNKALKEKIVHARHHVHKKGREVIGKPKCVYLDPYLQRVQARSIKLKMPYPRHEPFPIANREPTLIFMIDTEKLQIALTKVQQERDAWKNKYQFVNNENEQIQKHLKKKNEEELSKKKRKVQEDLFSSSIQLDTPPTSVAWKLIVDKLVLEKTQMEDQIKELNRKLQG